MTRTDARSVKKDFEFRTAVVLLAGSLARIAESPLFFAVPGRKSGRRIYFSPENSVFGVRTTALSQCDRLASIVPILDSYHEMRCYPARNLDYLVAGDFMRNSGMRFECITMRPHDHIGWVFDGPAGFDALAAPFLAEGAERCERLMYIASDPDPAVVSGLGAATGSHGVQVASIAEVYGATGVVDPSALLATFAAVFVDALAEGFRGIRVAADNTPLVTDEARLAAWFRWEIIADRFMSENPATAVCAFDREKVDVNRLRHLATLHPLSSADGPEPRYRLFAEEGRLRVEGQISSFAVSQIPLALEVLPPQTGVLIDLAKSQLTSRAPLVGLRELCDAGVTVTIQGEPGFLGDLAGAGLGSSDRLIFRHAQTEQTRSTP